MKNLLPQVAACALFVCLACRREPPPENLSTPNSQKSSFKEFIIPEGAHSAAGNDLKAIETRELKFSVRFDSSAVYQTSSPGNQYDINKLYGFSDNGDHHHRFSARFGWRWSDGALRVFAYVYNRGERGWKELSTVKIGDTVRCGIAVSSKQYLFTVNERVDSMPRMSLSDTARGYQLYPYFGGDEPAPHEVKIWIREERESK